ncbi:MAG: urea carboxylase-associated family protein [Chloroflexales bacterium]|nr:urea carboxylase-associated family protein [Chloroflexales bacterium]
MEISSFCWARYHLPPQTGFGLKLKHGQYLRVIDPEDAQVADLIAFAQHDITECLSSGRSFDYNGAIYLSEGHVLYSNRSNPMLSILTDDVGRHDFLFAACSQEMFQIQYGIHEPHPNCLDNLTQALMRYGVRSKPGDAIVLRAEMDLLVAVAACSAGVCNGGRCKPIDLEVSEV